MKVRIIQPNIETWDYGRNHYGCTRGMVEAIIPFQPCKVRHNLMAPKLMLIVALSSPMSTDEFCRNLKGNITLAELV